MKKRGVVRRLLPFIGRRRGYITGMVILSLMMVILNLYAPILIGQAIDTLKGTNHIDMHRLIILLGRLALVVAGASIAQWIVGLISNKISYGIVEDMRQKAFVHMQNLPIAYVDTHQPGELMNRIISDITLVSEGLLLGITQLIIGLFTIIGTIGFMVSIHLEIALIVVVLTPISLLIASYIAKKTFHFFQNQTKIRAQMATLTEEMIGNEKLVQAFSYEERAIARFEKVNEALKVCGTKALFFSALTNPATRLVNNLIYAVVCIYGAFAVLKGRMSIGQLIGFLQYANQYTKPFNEISAVFAEFTNALAGAERIFEFLDEPVKAQDSSEELVMNKAEQEIEMKHLSFSYIEEIQVLQDINFKLLQGQRVALVGSSGCGKTTLMNLMMRFYESWQGEICIGNQDIRKVSRQSLRKNIGMVLQETWLKSATVHGNIAYGKPQATREEVVQAAKNARAHSFIRKLPKGYDTQICEDGENLSKGQQQLLCIARVMLIEPKILLLDEATSSIDTRTELQVSKAFDELLRGRTSFVVAHRLSTITGADMILVMDKGRIVERGTHRELLDKQGFYAKLYQSQF